MSLDLKHLRAFCVLAEECHFGRAAHRLHTSQPVISRTLREMEIELGTRLVDRSARKVELTRAGRAFLGSAREALRNVETAVRAAQTGVGDGIERISLGLMIGCAHPVVGQLIADFRAANPSATVTITSVNERALGTSLIDGTLDAAVAYDECVPPGLHRQPLFKEPLDVLVAVEHPFAALETIAPSLLGTVPLILPDRRSHPLIYERFRTHLTTHGVEPDFAIDVDEMAQLYALVSAGAAVGAAPLAQSFSNPGIVRVPQNPRFDVGFSLVWSRFTQAVQALLTKLG